MLKNITSGGAAMLAAISKLVKQTASANFAFLRVSHSLASPVALGEPTAFGPVKVSCLFLFLRFEGRLQVDEIRMT